MSDSVEVRLDDDSLFMVIQRLEPEFGITGKNLVTVMSNSVTVRLDDDSFFQSLKPSAVVPGAWPPPGPGWAPLVTPGGLWRSQVGGGTLK